MFVHRHLVVWLRLRCGNENWFFLRDFERTVATRSAGDCPLAETMNRTQGDLDAMLFEPFGNLAMTPMLAAQGEDGFAMRLQFAARPALLLGFGLWL